MSSYNAANGTTILESVHVDSLPRETTVATPTPSTTVLRDHTWNGYVAYILRTNGKITKAVLGDITFKPFGIYIKASFYENGRRRKKDVDIITIGVLQLMWLNVDVMSDSESDRSDEETTLLESVHVAIDQTQYTEVTRLPSLTISKSYTTCLSREQKQAFQYVQSQTQSLLALTNRMHPIEDDMYREENCN